MPICRKGLRRRYSRCTARRERFSVIRCAVTSVTVRELKTFQDWVIERKLRAVPGVADIVSFGGEVKTFRSECESRTS